MSQFKRYYMAKEKVEVVPDPAEGQAVELLPHQFFARGLYDAWSELEDSFLRFGQEMFKAGMPIGLVMSEGFNSSTGIASRVDEAFLARFEDFKSKLRRLAHRDSPLSTGSVSKVKQDLEFSLWLLENTYCYVSYIEGSDGDDRKFVSGKVNTSVGTFNEALLLELGIDLPERVIKGINKMIDNLGADLQAGYLPFPVVEFNKQSVKVPRKRANFVSDEYMVVPVSLVMGWVKGLRESMRDNIVIINARKTEGALREFVMTSNSKAVGDVYNKDQEVIEMFEVSRSLPAQYPYFRSRVHNWEGLHNLNLVYYELGIPKEEYPKRMLNLNRIVSVEVIPVNESEEYNSRIRQVKRYANMDVDVVTSQVNLVTKDWDTDRLSDFLNETLNKLKSSLGAVPDSSVVVKSLLDFNLKFNQAIEHYSTSYVRTVVDYMLEHPVDFDNFTGNSVNISDVVSSVVGSYTGIVDLGDEDDDLEF